MSQLVTFGGEVEFDDVGDVLKHGRISDFFGVEIYFEIYGPVLHIYDVHVK